jgi:hypothetical protein
MDNLIPYIVDKKGKQWYICRDCANKEQFQFLFCPVCRNLKRSTNEALQKAVAGVLKSKR